MTYSVNVKLYRSIVRNEHSKANKGKFLSDDSIFIKWLKSRGIHGITNIILKGE